MRAGLLACVLLGACGAEPMMDPPPPADDYIYEFGPFTVQPLQELADDCIQITLNNADELYVNQVELTTGPGFHHSNWFFVPENVFGGPDGTWKCDDRNYSEPAAAIFGGVLFAQSTQAPNETQAFPAGVALKIPPRHKIIAQIHLLNTGDAPLELAPTIRLGPIPSDTVQTLLAGISFENQAIHLPANKESRFTIDCDLGVQHQEKLGTPPNFKVYYALAHYHDLGTQLDVEAVRPDGTTSMIYTTRDRAGDVLGGPIDPLFDMTGFTKLRFSCQYYNDRNQEVIWGIGDQEMCVFLAFSDSPYNWGGGVTSRGRSQLVPDSSPETYTHACDVFGIDADR